MIDAVLSLHMNPLTCGVAKFNLALADRLGVPCFELNGTDGRYLSRRPLISVKIAEWEREYGHWWEPVLRHFNSYELFLHDAPPDPDANNPRWAIQRAWAVYAASKPIADRLRLVRPDVVEAFCPATVAGDATRGAYRILVFGMASKLHLAQFDALRAELERDHPDYTISLSTAVHEGSPWDDGLTKAIDGMRNIFGDKLRVLGFLGDDALAKELHECDAVAAYFTPALRANNTSAWAALAAGKKLYTNTDEYSPPLDAQAHSWEKLLELIRAA